MGWILRLIETGPTTRRRSVDVMEIDRLPISAGSGVSLAQGKWAARAHSAGGCRGAGSRACRSPPPLPGKVPTDCALRAVLRSPS